MKTTDYSTTTIKYLTAVRKYLKEKYGKVNTEWEVALQLLSDKVELYQQCKDFIKENGLVMTAKNGSPTKCPLIKVMFDSEIQITKLLSEFGLTPRSAAKINLANEDDDELKELLGD